MKSSNEKLKLHIKEELEAFDVEKAFPNKLTEDDVVKMLSDVSSDAEDSGSNKKAKIISFRKTSAMAAAVVLLLVAGIVIKSSSVFTPPQNSPLNNENAGESVSEAVTEESSHNLNASDKKDESNKNYSETTTKKTFSSLIKDFFNINDDKDSVPKTDLTTQKNTQGTTAQAVQNIPTSDESPSNGTTVPLDSPTVNKPENDENSTVPNTEPSTLKPEGALPVNPSAKEGNENIFSYSASAFSDLYYTESDPWKRNVGIVISGQSTDSNIRELDSLMLPFSDSENEYALQIWKGGYPENYIGTEAGIYVDEAGFGSYKPTEQYPCDIKISLCKTDGEQSFVKRIFTREVKDSSWISGYCYGDCDFLTVKVTVTLNNEAEAASLAESLEFEGFREVSSASVKHPNSFSVSQNTVCIIW